MRDSMVDLFMGDQGMNQKMVDLMNLMGDLDVNGRSKWDIIDIMVMGVMGELWP